MFANQGNHEYEKQRDTGDDTRYERRDTKARVLLFHFFAFLLPNARAQRQPECGAEAAALSSFRDACRLFVCSDLLASRGEPNQRDQSSEA